MNDELRERITRVEVKLKMLETMEKRIKEHMILQLQPLINDVKEIKEKLDNGLSETVRINTEFRKNYEQILEKEAKKKEFWLYIVRAITVSSALALLGFLWFLITNYHKIVTLINSAK